MNAWAKLVQKTYNANKHKSGYKLKNAMRDSKKIYKTMKRRGGDPDTNTTASLVANAAPLVANAASQVANSAVSQDANSAVSQDAVGGKKKSKKNKSAKKSRKNRK
jgi:hypothetical protein